MKLISLVSLLMFLLAHTAFAQKKLSFEEKEDNVINYSNIKKVLKQDGLGPELQKKKEIVKKISSERTVIKKKRAHIPGDNDFYKLMSELWLVKNAQLLRWDFPKPKYGINMAFRGLLERFGYYNIHYKILILNSPTVTHFGLPAGDKSYIFVISLPFMRSLDLTKIDIALLLFEDFLRLERGYFVDNIEKALGQKKSNDKKILKKTLEYYSKIIFETGFNFQQQYELTKQIDKILKSDPPLWGSYFKLYKKIDRFIKTDLLYKNYLKVYPSPEMQLQWLSPKKKVI